MVPFVLIGCYFGFTMIYLLTNKKYFQSSRTRGRYALSIMLTITGITHFLDVQQFEQMIPPFLPFPTVIVLVAGVMELGFAIGLLTRKYIATIGILLAIFLVAVFPANIYNVINGNEVVVG